MSGIPFRSDRTGHARPRRLSGKIQRPVIFRPGRGTSRTRSTNASFSGWMRSGMNSCTSHSGSRSSAEKRIHSKRSNPLPNGRIMPRGSVFGTEISRSTGNSGKLDFAMPTSAGVRSVSEIYSIRERCSTDSVIARRGANSRSSCAYFPSTPKWHGGTRKIRNGSRSSTAPISSFCAQTKCAVAFTR